MLYLITSNHCPALLFVGDSEQAVRDRFFKGMDERTRRKFQSDKSLSIRLATLEEIGQIVSETLDKEMVLSDDTGF